MEFKDMEMTALEQRIAAIKDEAQSLGESDEDLEKLEALKEERTKINQEIEARRAAEAERRKAAEEIEKGAGTEMNEAPEERTKHMDNMEIRNTKQYIDAYAEYIKTGKDEEVRSLLSTNATAATGYVPVPEFVEGRINTAWQKLGLMDLVKKSYAKGNLKVGFELSASDAAIHPEGSAAVSEETLTFGVTELKPESIKKLLRVSDEALDMSSEEFLNYIYDEITYRIALKAQKELIAKIVACTTSASSTSVSVGEVDDGAPTLAIVSECIGKLSDEATNPVIVMNKGTWAQFKAAQYSAGYAIDPFEGLPVHFDNSLPVYSSTATTGTWLIVGDFGGAQANFPNGDEITIKVDELTDAASDLVRFIGREFVGLGLVADKAFCRVTMHT